MIVDGIVFKWRYEEGMMKLRGYEPYETIITECLVYRVEDTEKVVAAGRAYLGVGDIDSKDTGRKLSLARALDLLYPLPKKATTMRADDHMTWVHNKMMRFNVWEAYRTLPAKPRWGVARDAIKS